MTSFDPVTITGTTDEDAATVFAIPRPVTWGKKNWDCVTDDGAPFNWSPRGPYPVEGGAFQTDPLTPNTVLSTETRWHLIAQDANGNVVEERRLFIDRTDGGSYDWGEFSNVQVVTPDAVDLGPPDVEELLAGLTVADLTSLATQLDIPLEGSKKADIVAEIADARDEDEIRKIIG